MIAVVSRFGSRVHDKRSLFDRIEKPITALCVIVVCTVFADVVLHLAFGA